MSATGDDGYSVLGQELETQFQCGGHDMARLSYTINMTDFVSRCGRPHATTLDEI